MTTERRICRTVDEIHAAGRKAAQCMPDLTKSETSKVLALLAPYREQLMKRPESGAA